MALEEGPMHATKRITHVVSRCRLSALSTLFFITFSLRAADAPPRMEFTRLDDFEDAAPWVKGDPNTDLKQTDAAVAASTEVVTQGRQSVAFLIRVNWTPREGEQYPKGWPMMRRTFDDPRDWSDYDYVHFWVHARTKATLKQERVLRVGFPSPTVNDRQWYTIPGIVPNEWIEVAAPLSLAADRSRVAGVTFYIAEAWYSDRDEVDFFIDDMRLAKLTAPRLASCSVTARTFPRGSAVGLRVSVEGPYRGSAVRCRITDRAGAEQLSVSRGLQAREQSFALSADGLPAGEHYAMVELVDVDGQVVDSRRQYFRSLQPGRRCYLKLITFYTKPLGQRNAGSLAVLNESAYAGVAIPMMGSYETDPVPDYGALKPKLAMVREALEIDPWPWVALNRMIGAPTDRRGHAASHATNLAYFERIRGMDLDGETGARDDFLKNWRNAVRAACEWKSPGVMLDLEAYNDYRVYNMQWLAERRGETLDQVIAHCERLGADMARTIAEEYPHCLVWSLFSRLERSSVVAGRDKPVFTSSSYITLGMLEYARQNDVPLKYLCGGETTPGYCNKNVDALKAKIAKRDADVAPFLERFSHHFALAGTISPFHDYEVATGWIQRGYKDSDFRTIEDFEPMFRTLFDAYDWGWIYASSAAKTEPFKPENSARYGEVMRAALGP